MSNVERFVEEITNLLSSGEETKAMAVWDQIACEEDVPTVVEVHRKLADVGAIQRLTRTMAERRLSDVQRHDLWDITEEQ
tara:strand:+ start:306 stop:545 length:240 start_codon:yes stop_codon:yes gene_type:complete